MPIFSDNSLDQDVKKLVFPEEENQFLDRFIGVNKENQIVSVVSAGSKVGTGMNLKSITSVKEINVIGHKQNSKFSSVIKKKIWFLSLPINIISYKFTTFITVFLILGFVLVATSLALFVDLWTASPSLATILRQPIQSSIIYARDGKTKIYEYFKEERREFVPISRIPKIMQLAVIALEDENFYKNEQGIPWKNMLGAMQKCLLSGGDSCRGGSGLSQQLVKVMTNQKDNSVDRKVKELITAIKLNQEKNHTDLLEAYLNWVAFGRNAYGVEQASRAYYGRSIDEKNGDKYLLTPPEACFLAAMIQSPGKYPEGIGKPDSQNWKDLLDRKNSCLFKLRTLDLPIDDDGTIAKWINSDVELKRLQDQKAQLADSNKARELRDGNKIAFVNSKIEDPFPHFREYITNELKKTIGEKNLYEGGFRITTTLDPELQRKVEKTVADSEAGLNSVYASNAGSLVLDGPTGQILAMVGSLDYNRNDIDGKVNITTSPRQPGSSIKPYVYANMWSNGYSPATILKDAPINWDGYAPKNFSGNFNGPVTAHYSLQNSLNIPAVKALLLGQQEKSNSGWQSDPYSRNELVLNGLFNLAEKVGVNFPCIPSGDGESTCNNPEQAKTAYRNRCFVSSALGGCELTMISHATGFNTLLQEGNLHTASPFINILGKDNQGKEVDLYKSYENQFYPNVNSVIDPVVARQVASVMSDYETRAREFGALRFNLELNDKKWRVAAKTGTSNGPKDFWVMGGSPYYTVALWAGRNDNQNMSQDASASKVTGVIWHDIMESVHKDKTVKNFSTEGLKSVKGELLTQKQQLEYNEKSVLVDVKY
jgi:membrane peptidoglycan carboxypeptidase